VPAGSMPALTGDITTTAGTSCNNHCHRCRYKCQNCRWYYHRNRHC
jgi:hypothetical protein